MSNAPQQKLFLPFQSKWMKDSSTIRLIEKSRQVGISWATACQTVLTTSSESCRYDTWIASNNEFQAGLFLKDCYNFATELNYTTKKELDIPIINESSNNNRTILEFTNGRRITAISSSPNAQAGKRGSRILDEFALHKDPSELFAIAYPGITWGGQLSIISTHRGTNNFFNKLIQEIKHGGNPKNISLHRVTLQDAIEQGFLQKLQSKLPESDPRAHMDEAEYFDSIKNSCPDHESFLQEYMCSPSDDATAFLSHELIDAVEYPEDTNWVMTFKEIQDSKNNFYLGIDLGREHDLTVFWLLECVGDVLYTRLIQIFEKTPFSIQEKFLYDLLEIKNIRRICIDQTGMGRQFAERASTKYPARIEGINFTNSLKEALAYPVRIAMEKRQIRIPSCKYIRADLRSIKKEHTSAGNVRFCADRGTNGHADRFWALALAIHAAPANNSSKPFHYERISITKK